MLMPRRERRPQSGHTNRREVRVVSTSTLPHMQQCRSTAELPRPASAHWLSRSGSTSRLDPLSRRRPFSSLRQKKQDLAHTKSESKKNVRLEALIASISANLQQRYTGKRSLRKVFLAWDANRDGVVDPRELEEIFNKCGCNVSRSQAVEICKYYGDGESEFIPYDGFIDLIFKEEEVSEKAPSKTNLENLKTRLRELGVTEEEIERSATSHLQHLPLKEVIRRLKIKFQAKGSLQKEFRAMDDDKNGCISMEELMAFLRRIGLEASNEEVEDLFKKFDKTADGDVEYKEFINVVFPQSDVGAFRRLTPRSDGLEEDSTEGGDSSRSLEPEARRLSSLSSKQALEKIASHDLDNNVDSGIRDAVVAARLRKKIGDKLAKEFRSLDAAFQAIDANGDGRLSYAEFKSALMGLDLQLKPADADLFLRYIDKDGSGFVDYDEFQKCVDVDYNKSSFSFSKRKTKSQCWMSDNQDDGCSKSKGNNYNDCALGEKLAERGPDHIITNTRTATVSNVGMAFSNKLPSHLESRRINIKRRLFTSKSIAKSSEAQAERGEDRDNNNIEKPNLKGHAKRKDKFDVSMLHRSLSVPGRGSRRPNHDTTYLLRPQSGQVSDIGAERLRTETQHAFSLSRKTAYHQTPEQILKRERYLKRLENKRILRNKYHREEQPIVEDPDRHLKTILKQRLNYYARLDAKLEREAQRFGSEC